MAYHLKLLCRSLFYILYPRLLDQTGYMAEQLASVRRLYEIENISNRVVDGREPFPENRQKLNDGISVEFR